MNENEPRNKKRAVPVQVTCQGPVPKNFCCVPMDTIRAYKELLPEFQRLANEVLCPVYLLCGPRHFGKTTLALRLTDQINRIASVEVIFLSLSKLTIASACSFWDSIGRQIGVEARAILQVHRSTRKVHAEVRACGEKRFDLAIINGSSCGFELKSNKLSRGEIEAAVEQADGYKRRLRIGKMFLVNFVSRNHQVDDIYHIDTFPDIQVIHIHYSDTYCEYVLNFLGDNGEKQTRKVVSTSS